MLDANLNNAASETIHFDFELPHYKTKDGVYRAIDRILSPIDVGGGFGSLTWKICESEIVFWKMVAVSGNRQQHGSVLVER